MGRSDGQPPAGIAFGALAAFAEERAESPLRVYRPSLNLADHRRWEVTGGQFDPDGRQWQRLCSIELMGCHRSIHIVKAPGNEAFPVQTNRGLYRNSATEKSAMVCGLAVVGVCWSPVSSLTRSEM